LDNLTHSLVGLAAARAGLERSSPYATFVCVAAANLPDADIVALFGGQYYYLEHHRGITHSIVGTLALALLLPVVVYFGERVFSRLRGREPRANLKGLVLCSLILGASHPLLDWTNNYGVRPLLPWDGLRIYGDLVFILDPWLWLLLGGASVQSSGATTAPEGSRHSTGRVWVPVVPHPPLQSPQAPAAQVFTRQPSGSVAGGAA